MAFEKPEILLLFFLLIIPILIHLFNLKKYKKVYFPNIQLLQKIKKEKRKISKIKHLLILLSRLLIMSSLILAFSKPYIPGKVHIGKTVKEISIYLDNSLSMSMKNKNILLEEAKNNAIKIINSLNNETKINIITNDFEFKNERFFNKEKSLKLVESITLSPFELSLCEVIKRQDRIIKHDTLVRKFIISDFQKNFTQEHSNCKERIKEYNLIEIKPENINNISLNSCNLKSPFRKLNQEEQLIVEIENHSNEDRENILLELYINNEKRGFLNLDIKRKSKIKKNIPFKNLEAGNVSGRIKIENDDFQFDNTLFFSYEIKEKINILSISENNLNNSIKTVFNDSIFNLDVFRKNQINFEKLKDYDLIILDNLTTIQKALSIFIKQNLKKGKNIILFPNKNIDLDSYNFLLKEIKGDPILNWNNKKQNVKKINYNHLIFENVFVKKEKNIQLPNSTGYYQLKKNKLNLRNNILNFINDEPFIVEYNNFKGDFYFCSSPLDLNITNFTKHAMFLPIMYNASFNTYSSKLYETINQNLQIKCPECKIQSTTFLKKDEFEVVLENEMFNNNLYLKIGTRVEEEGIYNLHSSEKLKKHVSFNFNRNEGKISNNSLKNKENIFLKHSKNDNINLNKKKKQKNLIFYFIIIGIISFLFETLILKFWKN